MKFEGTELRFEFKGKSGKVWRLRLRDRRIAKVVRARQELPASSSFSMSTKTHSSEAGYRRLAQRHDVQRGCPILLFRGVPAAEAVLPPSPTARNPQTAATASARPDVRFPRSSRSFA